MSASRSETCSGVASPDAHWTFDEPVGHSRTVTSTLPYQSSLSLDTCICRRLAAPTNVSETNVTRMTEMVIDRLRRSPMPISERMN